MNEVDAMFVDCYQQDFWVIWLRRLFDLKECGSKGWPFVDDPKELHFGFLRRHSGVLVVISNDVLNRKQNSPLSLSSNYLIDAIHQIT